jgi:hypothetical protein
MLSVSRLVKEISGAKVGIMNRRDFLQSGGIVSVSLAFAKAGRLFPQVTTADRWRTFQVTTRVEVLKTSGTTRIWVPAALISETPFQKTLANSFSCDGGTAKMVESKTDALGIITAEFPAGLRPILTSQAGSRLKTMRSISPLPARHQKRTARNWNTFCGRPSSCRPTVS